MKNISLSLNFTITDVEFTFFGEDGMKFHFATHTNLSNTFCVTIRDDGKKVIKINKNYFNSSNVICVYCSDIPCWYLKVDIINEEYELIKVEVD